MFSISLREEVLTSGASPSSLSSSLLLIVEYSQPDLNVSVFVCIVEEVGLLIVIHECCYDQTSEHGEQQEQQEVQEHPNTEDTSIIRNPVAKSRSQEGHRAPSKSP